MAEIIFPKKQLQRITFGLGRFTQCFFLIFRRRPTTVAFIFAQRPHHKKASYGPVRDWAICVL